jgi:hypothetical protein
MRACMNACVFFCVHACVCACVFVLKIYGLLPANRMCSQYGKDDQKRPYNELFEARSSAVEAEANPYNLLRISGLMPAQSYRLSN